MKYLPFILLLFLIACKQKITNPEIKKWEQQAENITIIRDDFGVPHIYGKTDADAVFGLLYAQCEDDFARVEKNYIWAIGRLAEVEGEEALYSDVRASLFMTKAEAIQEYNKSPEWLRKLCDAFADGINYYLYTHPEVKPALISHFEPWMPMYFSEGSIGGDIERISTKRVKAFYEKDQSLSISAMGDGLTHPDPDNEPKGSNGIAISGKLTKSGNAILLINPHTSFYFRGEVHVVSEEGLNAYGAVTWGQFFVYQGFNEKTGWMHTSTYTDVIDEFKETVSMDGDKLFYTYGNEQRPVKSYEVVLKYKEGRKLSEKKFRLFRTHHGPITHKLDDHWVATAMMWSPSKALEQSYIRTKQSGHDEFYQMMEMHTNSSNNTVYADAEGNIAYYHGNFIPIRNDAFDYSKPVDGSDPETDWKGLHSVAEAITVVNPPNGWIQNCNSTPYTSAAEYSPRRGDYPSYMSIDRENHRGIHAIRLLKKASEMTIDKVIELAHDPLIPAFEELIPGLVKAYDSDKKKYAMLAEPIELLRNWDFKTSKNSIEMTLAHFYGMQSYKNGKLPPGIRGLARIDFYSTKSPEEERLNIFQSTIGRLEKDFGTWKMTWGEVNRFQRLSGDIDLKFDDNKESIAIGFGSGRWGALASYGSSTKEGSKKLYGSSGNSFVAVVEFGDKVKAKSILAGGQSSDINSPHFDDQAQRYADMNWKDVAYYREDVEKRAEKTYRPGKH